MGIEYKKVSENVVHKITTEEIDLAPIKKELEEIEQVIKLLDKEPDFITTENHFKIFKLERLNERKSQLMEIIPIK